MKPTIGDKIRKAYQHIQNSEWNKEITLESTIGENAASRISEKSWFCQELVDTLSNNVYSFVIGTWLDTCKAHLEPDGWLASRGFAVILNSLTGGVYGNYRNVVFDITRTRDESSLFKKMFADFIAFNTFQTPVYGLAIGIATLISEGSVDMEKVRGGIEGIAILSPIISPTLGWTQDKTRRYCGFGTAAEQSGKMEM